MLMEEQKPSLLELQIDDVAVPSLKETAKWTKFLSITCIVFIVLMVLCALLASSTIATIFARMSAYSGDGGMGIAAGALTGGIIMGVMLVFAVVLAVVTYFLYAFSTQVRKAVDFNNQPALEKGIASLKNFFMVAGILGILSLLSSLMALAR